MEYIMINESKLKVMMEKNDLENRDISVEELDYANPYAKLIFEEILGYAKDELGFDTSGYRVLLQLYPSRDGGCELFISLLGESRRQEGAEQCAPRLRAYSFSSLLHLLAACRRMAKSGFFGESSAYFDGEHWYLILTDIDLDLEHILEYGEAESTSALLLYLCEYAHTVCRDNAVFTLSKI